MISGVICYSGYKIRESNIYNLIIELCINIYIGLSHDIKYLTSCGNIKEHFKTY